MSSTSRIPTSISAASFKDASAISTTIGWLRAEHAAAESPSTRAMLLHEIGLLEERLGDEAAAARDLLNAVNTDPEFREPLERLIAIVERRQSYKNLGKLLERLTRVADTSSERSRALIEHAAFLADHDRDLNAARAELLNAAEETPEDPAVWLSLELLAARLGDAELIERALTARADLSQNPTFRALLLLDLAQLRDEREDPTRAFEAIDQAIAQGGEATFQALIASERLAHRRERPDIEAKALETQGELVLRALTEPVDGDALGVPKRCRTRAWVADTWLRAAELQRQRGETAQATQLLDRALVEIPEDVMLVHARLALAESLGDTAAAARLARVELDRGVDGELGAALWLRVAEAAAAEGDAAAALEAVERALALSPGCAPARALELDLLSAQGDAPRLAAALETTAEQLETDSAKANFYLMSADVWARLAGDVSGAKAALSQASMFGTPPSIVARVARALSMVLNDTTWYEDSTRRLIAQGANEDELPGLWFELGRGRALRGDRAGARAAFTALAATPNGSLLGHGLGAYVEPLIAQTTATTNAPPSVDELPWSALLSLAEREPVLENARALSIAVALRALAHGDAEAALGELERLHTEDGSDLVVSAALAMLYRSRGAYAQARDVLRASVDPAGDPDLATTLQIAAGVLSWQAGDRQDAVDAFTRAADERPDVATRILGWALRAAAAPSDVAQRTRALEAFAETDPALAALERFALELGSEGSPAAAELELSKLNALNGDAPRDLARAGELGAALWMPSASERERRTAALEALSRLSPRASALAHAFAHRAEIEDSIAHSDPERARESAERWAEADPGVAPVLEWLAFSLTSNDAPREVAAREELALRLPEELAPSVQASAAIVSMLAELEAPLPEGTEPAAVLTRLELTPPGSDPAERALALTLATPALGEEAAPLATTFAAYNYLASGDLDNALAGFRRVVEAYPEDVIAWEGLRATALASGDRPLVAEASAALGDAVGDAEQGAALWEDAASILLDELGDAARGEFALRRAVDRDVRRFSAFDRLFRIVRAKKDGAALLELIERRLSVATQHDELVKLHWERARVLRETGARDAALAELAIVREMEPTHVGALALTGEISITLGRYAEAAENLEQLSRHHEAPAQQRLVSGIAAVDLYENRLQDPNRALGVLSDLFREGLSTQPVRERLARTAALVGAWEQATEVLEQLMNERATSAGRMEAARLAMAIYRDELNMPEAAQDAVTRLLQEAPADGEGLDLVLTSAFSESLTRSLLERGLSTLVTELVENPMNLGKVDRLARIAEKLDRAPLRQAALGVLVALGAETRQIDPELSRLDQRVAGLPRIVIDDRALPDLADPEDTGSIPELMRAIASTVAQALGPGLGVLGVTKKDRVDPREGLPLRNEIAKWAGALGIPEFDLYVGGRDPTGVCGVATEPPSLVIGSAVSAPLSPYYRQAVARELFALRRGTSILRHREAAEVHALIVATCRVAEVELPSPPFALLAEFQRLLSKEMPRRVKKSLPELARAVRDNGEDPVAWYRAAQSTLDRMASIAAGDVSWVLSSDSRERGQTAPTHEARQRAGRLLSFVLSPVYLDLREKLGMGVR